MLKKCRIQLFDKDFNQVTDKLVAQDSEFYKGLEENHDGPIKLEICLFEKDDIEKSLEYIQKLVGIIPVTFKAPRASRSRIDFIEDNSSSRKDFIEAILNNSQSQEWVISSLRESGFIAMYPQEYQDRELQMPNANNDPDLMETLMDPDPATNGWVIFLRVLKEAKSPVNDKFDPSLLVFFKLNASKSSNKVYYYCDNSVFTFTLEAGSQKPNINANTSAKFPHYMTLEEREKFRIEMYKARRTGELRFTKFFKRWVRDVEFTEKAEWIIAIENESQE